MRNVSLGLAAIMIVVNILGMLDVIPTVAAPRELNIAGLVLILMALAFRRRSTPPRP